MTFMNSPILWKISNFINWRRRIRINCQNYNNLQTCHMVVWSLLKNERWKSDSLVFSFYWYWQKEKHNKHMDKSNSSYNNDLIVMIYILPNRRGRVRWIIWGISTKNEMKYFATEGNISTNKNDLVQYQYDLPSIFRYKKSVFQCFFLGKRSLKKGNQI